MDAILAEQLELLGSAEAKVRSRAAMAMAAALRKQALDGTPLVPALLEALARALAGGELRTAQEVTAVLHTIAWYRRGDIGLAIEPLARLVSHENQELRKRAADALLEAAENGPGAAAAVPVLTPLLAHRMKHVRSLAAAVLTAQAVDGRDLPTLEGLLANPRPDVAERALGYLRRGAEWKDISFAVPLLCHLFAAGDERTRRRAVQVLDGYLSGSKGTAIDPALLGRRAEEILKCLGVLDQSTLPGGAELREKATRVAGAAVSDAELSRLVDSLGSRDAAACAEAAHTLQLAANQGVDISAAVAALRALLDQPGAQGQGSAVFALVKHHAGRRDFAAVESLLDHPHPRVRVGALRRLDLEAIGSTTNFTPLVAAVARCLDDTDAMVRECAARCLQSFASLGSAADRTSLAAAAADLRRAAASDDPVLAPLARQALELAVGLGGLDSGSR